MSTPTPFNLWGVSALGIRAKECLVEIRFRLGSSLSLELRRCVPENVGQKRFSSGEWNAVSTGTCISTSRNPPRLSIQAPIYKLAEGGAKLLKLL